ncbi:cupredoxin family protein [Hydrogenophaga sp.]|uniref:cupredoxin domain-containing protein n=1 Tax=Hydrogenophaga sp. TaxID=1904254 RepID=UPI002731B49B|nr:cupredoxin family protein [Hydrogenophaga sp.]MDP1687974.1 cupredoxin family protein [Hydrogenophaga sp.]
MTFKTRRSLLALPWLLALPRAFAHGEQHPKSAAPLVKEQKPWGIAGEPAQARRTVDIRMTDDMKMSPNHIDVREGETVRIRAINAGKVLHEIVIGTGDELKAHAEMMKKFPNMEHDEPYMAHVSPGKRGDIVWTFNRPGDFEFACLIAGHFEAGMRGTIRVAPKA